MGFAMMYGGKRAPAKTHPDDAWDHHAYQHEDAHEHGAHHDGSVGVALRRSVERFSDAPLFSGMFMALGKPAARVMMCPPKTWEPYLKKRDYYGIYEMEAREFAKAVMAPASEHADVDMEMTHMVAALMMCVIYRDE